MNIDDFLEEVESLCELEISAHPRDGQVIRAMYRALECTVDASRVDNETHLTVFIQLLMVIAKDKKNPELVMRFTNSIIAADYYFSVMKAKKAISFMNKAFDSLSVYLDNELPLLVADNDEFIMEFRTRNLQGQKQRKDDAVNNIYILNAAAEKLELDLALPELLMDYVPDSWHFKHMAFLLMLSLSGASLFALSLTESMSPWRRAIADGTPISLWEAFVPMDMLSFVIGLILIVLAFVSIWWMEGPSYIRLMSKWSYWRYNR